MNKIALILSFLVLSVFRLSGQEEDSIMFDHYVWDFGKVNESDKSASHRFYFTNHSDKPIIIASVSSTCNCAAPEYSRESILPGKKGFVAVKMNMEGMLGDFEKKLSVTVLAGKEMTTSIYVRGYVLPRNKEIGDDYTYKIGNGFQLRNNALRMGYVHQGSIGEVILEYVNNSRSAITVQASIEQKDAVFSISRLPLTIPAKTEGRLMVKCDLGKTEAWAILSGKVKFTINGNPSPHTLELSAIGVGKEIDESKKTIVRLNPSFYNAGQVLPQAKKDVAVELHNDGSYPLFVYAIQLDSGMTSTLKSGVKILPGKSHSFRVSVTYPAKMEKGRMVKSLYLVTNDKTNMLKSLHIIGTI